MHTSFTCHSLCVMGTRRASSHVIPQGASLHCQSVNNNNRLIAAYAITTAQQTREIEPFLVQCWASVVDDGPTLKQKWPNVSCCWVGLGKHSSMHFLYIIYHTDSYLDYNSYLMSQGKFYKSKSKCLDYNNFIC